MPIEQSTALKHRGPGPIHSCTSDCTSGSSMILDKSFYLTMPQFLLL